MFEYSPDQRRRIINLRRALFEAILPYKLIHKIVLLRC